MSGLRLQNLTIALDKTRLLSVNADIACGEVLTVMGPSGSGKSSLIAALIGTLAPEFTLTGSMMLNDRPLVGLAPFARRIGVLFQDDLLFPHMSVAQNLGFGLDPAIRSADDRRQHIETALEDVGLAGFAERDPATLSGGQRARVSLQRMLLSAPDALLLDEPFSKLDQNLRVDMRNLVFQAARARDLPVLLVTHDIDDAKAAGPHVITLG